MTLTGGEVGGDAYLDTRAPDMLICVRLLEAKKRPSIRSPASLSNGACQFFALLSADQPHCAISFRPAVSTLMA